MLEKLGGELVVCLEQSEEQPILLLRGNRVLQKQPSDAQSFSGAPRDVEPIQVGLHFLAISSAFVGDSIAKEVSEAQAFACALVQADIQTPKEAGNTKEIEAALAQSLW